jgi:hypothetical protein
MTTMPDVAGGWVRLLLGALGGKSGAKFYIWGVAGYNKPIWDVLAPEGEREEAGEHIDSPKLIKFFPIRQVVPVGLAQASFCSCARCARFFIEKKVYCSNYSIFVCILPFSSSQGREEWMDGVGRVWMTPS